MTNACEARISKGPQGIGTACDVMLTCHLAQCEHRTSSETETLALYAAGLAAQPLHKSAINDSHAPASVLGRKPDTRSLVSRHEGSSTMVSETT